MAQMIPDRLPSGSSKGEQRLFAILQRLPDVWIIYYEPVISDRYPDFVVIAPDLGIAVIEVKGWNPNDILGSDLQTVRVRDRGLLKNEVHRRMQGATGQAVDTILAVAAAGAKDSDRVRAAVALLDHALRGLTEADALHGVGAPARTPLPGGGGGTLFPEPVEALWALGFDKVGVQAEALNDQSVRRPTHRLLQLPEVVEEKVGDPQPHGVVVTAVQKCGRDARRVFWAFIVLTRDFRFILDEQMAFR
jgi:hypothetical protein